MIATLDAAHIEAALDALLRDLEAAGVSRQSSYRMIFTRLSLKALNEGGADLVDTIADGLKDDAISEMEIDKTRA